MLLFAGYIFDASIIDMFGCLATSGTLCISTPTKLRSNLAQVVNERLVDHAHLTLSVAQVLHPDDWKSLRTLVIGRERMSTVLQASGGDGVGHLRLRGRYAMRCLGGREPSLCHHGRVKGGFQLPSRSAWRVVLSLAPLDALCRES